MGHSSNSITSDVLEDILVGDGPPFLFCRKGLQRCLRLQANDRTTPWQVRMKMRSRYAHLQEAFRNCFVLLVVLVVDTITSVTSFAPACICLDESEGAYQPHIIFPCSSAPSTDVQSILYYVCSGKHYS